jgi:hypothetical protein
MRHESALRRLDELDAGEAPGLALRLHFAVCPSCARQAELMRAALRAYRAAAPLVEGRSKEGGALEERIMASVRLTPPPRQDFAVGDWLMPAVVILLSICLVQLGSGLGLLRPFFGSGSAVYLSLVLSLAFIAYSALFVASHLDELQAFLQKRGLLSR